MEYWGIIVFLLGIVGIRKYIRQRKYGAFTDATVSKIERTFVQHKQVKRYYDRPYMTFTTVSGEQFTARSRIVKVGALHVGDTVRILYQSNNPQGKIYITQKRSSAYPFVLVVAGVILMVIGFLR